MGVGTRGQDRASADSETLLEKPLTPQRTARAQGEGHHGQKGQQKRLMQMWQVLLSLASCSFRLIDRPGCRESRRRAEQGAL